MKTNGNKIFCFPASIRFLAGQITLLLFLILLADCNKDEGEDYRAYWADKYYQLDWNLPVDDTTMRFIGHVRECKIGEVEAKFEFSGTWDNLLFDTEGEYHTGDILELEPGTCGPDLPRSFSVHIVGTVTGNETTCAIDFTFNISYDVNVETNTAILRMAGTGTSGWTQTCGGYSIPVYGFFSTLLTHDELLNYDSEWSACY